MVIFRFSLVCFFLAIGFLANAQYRILLTNYDNGEQKTISKGFKIIYRTNGENVKCNRIKEINSNVIITKEDTFKVHDLVFIGYENSAKQLIKFGAQVSIYGSYGMLFLAYIAFTQIPQYPEIGSVLAGMGFVPLILSKKILDSNSYTMFDLSQKWRAEIVKF